MRLFVIGAAVVPTLFWSGCGGEALVTPVGQPCTPSEERDPEFSGFNRDDVTLETHAADCESGTCLIANFQGRTTCPYGQAAGPDGVTVDPTIPEAERCRTPGADGRLVTVPVAPQRLERPPSSSVYCSCRCDGADKTRSYCACPSGFSCAPVAPDLGLGDAADAGSYCVKVSRVFDDRGECRRPATPRIYGGCGP